MKPDAYQKGWIEFYKLRFKVTPDVLIPRPETELLVDNVLDYIINNPIPLTILDLGTGSGAIAISLAKNLSDSPAQIIASEVSPQALEIAKRNSKLHLVGNKIQFVQSNLLENITTEPDIIVTNLPYIPSHRIAYLDPSVKDYEPRIALDGGEDGFDLYRKLFQQIQEKKWKPNLIVGEIDYTQADTAYAEAKKYFPGYQTEVKLDLAYKQRILIIGRVAPEVWHWFDAHGHPSKH